MTDLPAISLSILQVDCIPCPFNFAYPFVKTVLCGCESVTLFHPSCQYGGVKIGRAVSPRVALS